LNAEIPCTTTASGIAWSTAPLVTGAGSLDAHGPVRTDAGKKRDERELATTPE